MTLLDIIRSEELGKWFLELSKYLATVVLIGAIFGETISFLSFTLALVATLAFLLIGLWFMKRYKDK